MFNAYILKPIIDAFKMHSDRSAFYINNKSFSYSMLAETVSKTRLAIQKYNPKKTNIGLVINDDLETYASIIAIWLEGLAYVPLHPNHPFERNQEIISQVDIDLIIDSANNFESGITTIHSSELIFEDFFLVPKETSENELAYILFTSGSTGKPKGVPISRANLGAFVDAFWKLGYKMNENDRCLQPFDLTFDLSVMSYLIPLTKGACVYPVPGDCIKYSYIAELLEDQQLTFALMVPSTIRFLKPYFDEIDCPSLKYNLFCGEALPLNLVKQWSICIPNAEIDNVYGPTEDTIFCSRYNYIKEGKNKAYNGIMSIGKSMANGDMIILNAKNKLVENSEQGELCLSGEQLTPGYWKNPGKNKDSFFIHENGHRFYRTGDICFADEEGDIMYVGRKDQQVKIQGFRVELGEIEHYSREYLKGSNAVSIPLNNNSGNTEIALVIENKTFDTKQLYDYLKSKLSYYMLPTQTYFIENFPLNNNSKIDRNKLRSIISKEQLN